MTTHGARMCWAVGCNVPLAAGALMCPGHWSILPRHLRRHHQANQRLDHQPSAAQPFVIAAAIAIVAVAEDRGRDAAAAAVNAALSAPYVDHTPPPNRTHRDLAGRFVGRPEAERFWEQVVPTPGLWEWTGRKDRHGYGLFAVKRGQRWTYVLAHRYAHQHLVGSIPPGYTLDHRRDLGCGHHHCVLALPDARLSHLEPVTHLENLRREHLWRRAHREQTEARARTRS